LNSSAAFLASMSAGSLKFTMAVIMRLLPRLVGFAA
jgi:hypothetical protein